MAKRPKPSTGEPATTGRPFALEPTLTQRAYTLRLRGVNPQDTAWRDALWATHEAINKGAKVFGDWLLTLRGGLSHELADARIKGGKGKSDREPTPEERGNRRILLALSWLSVESEPTTEESRKQFVVAGGQKVQTANGVRPANYELALRTRLRDILRKRGVSDSAIGDPGIEPENQTNTWLGDCGPSLAARIRNDAVWMDRSGMFDALTDGWNKAQSRSDVHTLLSFILSANKDDFLELPAPKKLNKKDDKSEEDAEKEEQQKALKASSKGAGQRTRHPFSHLLGEGKPFGKPTRSLDLRSQWHDVLKRQLEEATRIPIVPVRQKGAKKDKNAGPAHTELQREMFSKAASRVAQIVTKQRQQEADRLARKNADKDLVKMEHDRSFDPALAALKTYCDDYRIASGATGEFRIRPAQITGWSGVVKRWAVIKEDDVAKGVEARIQAVKDAQDADEEKKFGDANLFFRLAEERFADAWRSSDRTTDPTILERFVRGMKARSDSERLKVAAYRHPDPYLNPIFCQFGVSRPEIHFRRLKAFTNAPAGNNPRAVGMLLWHPEAGSAKMTLINAVSRRLDREIGSACDAVQEGAQSLPEIPRRGRLGAAAGGLLSVESPSRVAGVFDLKKIKGRTTDDNEDDDYGNEDEDTSGKLKEPKWNGTLSARRRELVVIRKLLDKGDTHRANHRRDQLRWTLTVSMEMEGRGPWPRYVDAFQDQTAFVRTARKDEPKDRNDHTQGWKRRKGDTFLDCEGWPWQELNKPLKDNRDGTALVDDTGRSRGDKACLILSRLPGLRVLSVDLGHRYAAACAVCEALDRRVFDMRKIVTDAKAKEAQGWRVDGTPDGLFVHIHTPTDKVARNGRNKGKPITETTVYRRIGSDKLPNGSDHPAPWARLNRQFLIKLQGEERPAREASNEELWLVHEFERHVGITVPLIDCLLRSGWGSTTEQKARLDALRAKGWKPSAFDQDGAVSRVPDLHVDELMSEAVRTIRLALRNHGDAAKIAFGLTSKYKPMSGDRKFWFNKAQDNDSEPMKDAEKKARERAEKHTEYLQDMLMLWQNLAVSAKWRDDEALRWWNDEHTGMLPLIKAAPFTPPRPPSAEDQTDKKKLANHEVKVNRWKEVWEQLQGGPLTRRTEKAEGDADRAQRKADREAIHALLAPVAEVLRGNLALRQSLSEKWERRWKGSDGDCAVVPKVEKDQKGPAKTEVTTQATGWHARLRLLTDWIMGRNLPGTRSKTWSRNVGGVSLTRIATMKSLYQLHKAFAMRAEPDNPRGAPERGESNEGVAQSILDAMDRMREQRVKQIASRIVEAALGVGRIKKEQLAAGAKRPTARVDEPCHAIVTENLRNYRFVETQPRRENKALMTWSAGKVRKYLEEATQLHGLHLREVQPHYTSRQCSRTGLPGVRCVDIPVDSTAGEPKAYWWKKALSAAKSKIGLGDQNEKKGDAESRFIVNLAEHVVNLKGRGEHLPTIVRVPRNGGDLFVAAPPWSCRDKGHRPCPLCDAGRAAQADLNAAANIGLRAILDPDFSGKWWYVPAAMNNGWRIPAPKSCAGAACLLSWKVAQKDGYLSDDGKPLAVVDDTAVKTAEEAVVSARKKLDAATKAATKPGADQAVVDAAKARYEQAKTMLKEAKKAVSQKEIVNIWQDPSAVRTAPASGRWWESTAYWNIVRTRVISRLRATNGLNALHEPEPLAAADAPA